MGGQSGELWVLIEGMIIARELEQRNSGYASAVDRVRADPCDMMPSYLYDGQYYGNSIALLVECRHLYLPSLELGFSK